jgi:collagen triple helix repeat protein
MRSKLTYANVAATLALVFSMSGGALAAQHYLINSTRQINPKVLKKLAGKPGHTGPTGVTGKEGPQGKEGSQGKEGLRGQTGAAGNAVALARVGADGKLVGADSKNISGAELTATPGVYCISTSVPVQSITVSEPHVGGDEGGYAQADITALDGVNLNCPGATAYVITWKFGGKTLEDHPFYVVFD